MDQNIILTVFIYNLKTVWHTKIPMPRKSALDNIVKDSWIIFQSVDDFEIAHTTC